MMGKIGIFIIGTGLVKLVFCLICYQKGREDN